MKDHDQNDGNCRKPFVPNALDYQAPTQRPRKRYSAARRVAVLLTAICLIAFVWHVTYRTKRVSQQSHKTTEVTSLPSGNVTEFYRSEISPLLDASLQRNRRAADRAIASLHERFNAHRAGVKPFAHDVSGWATRLGVVERFASDVWDKRVGAKPNANAVGDYIQGKFRFHVLSEQTLEADVQEVLKQYREDLEASRNQLFAEIRLPLRGSQSPIALDDREWQTLCLDVDRRAKSLNATTPRDSVVTGLAALASGWIGTEAAEAIVAQILIGVGEAVAVEAAEAAATAGGSAVVGGAGTGGGVGSLGGPAGTAIGVGVGLAVGAAIDWWMSDRLEAHVADQCDKFLDTVEGQIVEGSNEAPGLRASFEKAVKIADERQRQAIIDALLEAGK